jgi:hypothetical protein
LTGLTLAEANARFFALCRLHRITPPLDEHNQPTPEGWLDAAPVEESEAA